MESPPLTKVGSPINSAEVKPPSPPRRPKTNMPTIINNYYYVQPNQVGIPPTSSGPNFPVVSSQSNPIKESPNNQSRRQYPQQYKGSRYYEHDNRHVDSLSSCSEPHSIHSSESTRIGSYDDSRDCRHQHHHHQNYSQSQNLPAKGSSIHSKHSPTKYTHSGVSSPKTSQSNERRLNDEDTYNMFITKSSSQLKNPVAYSTSRKENIDSVYNSDRDIYSSTSVMETPRLKGSDLDMKAKIPDIEPDGILDNFEKLSLKNNFNLIFELMKFSDEDINVHNNQFYSVFKSCCDEGRLMGLETLGSILYDPYDLKSRFSFKSLKLITQTFVSKTSQELDFRGFVKMCKFVKGCYVSFNYHDKRGTGHVLDFEEFQLALLSNGIEISDRLLAKIFENTEYVDFEHYIAAIILIRTSEKKS